MSPQTLLVVSPNTLSNAGVFTSSAVCKMFGLPVFPSPTSLLLVRSVPLLQLMSFRFLMFFTSVLKCSFVIKYFAHYPIKIHSSSPALCKSLTYYLPLCLLPSNLVYICLLAYLLLDSPQQNVKIHESTSFALFVPFTAAMSCP